MMKEKSFSDDAEYGEVYVATEKGLFPFSLLKQAKKKPNKSKQIKEDHWAADHGLIPHPFHVEEFLSINCIREYG